MCRFEPQQQLNSSKRNFKQNNKKWRKKTRGCNCPPLVTRRFKGKGFDEKICKKIATDESEKMAVG
jgi:hypothetical protein